MENDSNGIAQRWLVSMAGLSACFSKKKTPMALALQMPPAFMGCLGSGYLYN
jgi:hypothetical protein